jgi:endoplasmic reticulum lectin 1
MKCLILFLLDFGLPKLSPFKDDILYDIRFENKANLEIPGILYDRENEFVIMKNTHNEEYKCYIPIDGEFPEDSQDYSTQPAQTLLLTIFKLNNKGKPQCSYRLETYWSYEVCHGHHIRQYHEEKVKGGTKLTEFYLGRANGADEVLLYDPAKVPKTRAEVTKKNIDGIQTPYFEIEMSSGTPCPLNGDKPRKSRVQYICNPNAFHNEILSITETSTCQYEIVILTASLCKSPVYAQQLDKETFGIPCEKIGDAPRVPTGYVEPVSEASDTGLENMLKELLGGAGSEDVAGGIGTKPTEMYKIDKDTGELIKGPPMVNTRFIS